MSRGHMHSRPPLWLALRMPHLPLEVLGHGYNSATPVIVSEKRRVYALNALALAEGINRDMPLSTAQSLSAATTLEREPEQEQDALQRIAEACYQFTPYIEFYDEQSLLLEISRSLTLFRDVENLVRKLIQSLSALCHQLLYGLAHTGKAAWLLSWQHHPVSVQDDHKLFQQRLQQVPLHLLKEFPDKVSALQKSGFQTLGDVVQQMSSGHGKSGAALARRFGADFTRYLESILGSDGQTQGQLFARPPEIFQPEEDFQVRIQFDYPIVDTEQLRDPMQQLLENLVEHLKSKQLQCHAIHWRLFDIHQNRQDITVSTERIHSQWQLPLDLTMIQLERLALTFEVDSLELICDSTTPLATENHALLGRQINEAFNADSERLFARLVARLGKQSLSKLSYSDDFFPENCQQPIPVVQNSKIQLPERHLNAPRPSWLFQPPEAVQKKNQELFWHGPLQLLQGPERLRGHWWNTPCARDYFMAMRSDYVRCWVYQDLISGQWYVHGVFG